MWPSTDVLEITCAELAELRRRGAPLRLVDCRELDEWRLCHLEGAELVPLSQFAELAPQRFADSGDRVVVYCHHGMRSQRATMFLRRLGVHQAWSMRGGIDLWALEQDLGMARY